MLRIPLFLSLVFLVACSGGENHQKVGIDPPAAVEAEKAATPDSFDASFADGMTETVFQHYLKLRTALVNDDGDDAAAAAGNLAESLGNNYPELKKAATVISITEDVAAQRAAFAAMTEEIEPLISQGITGGTIYKQYCPMAFDNAGAEWFSDAKEIRNPYFGERMLKCGKVVATLE
ncbi:MAG: DUF3347 domain-containing protein [Bacteroidota bacterium]